MKEKGKHGELHNHDFLPIHDDEGEYHSMREEHRRELKEQHLNQAIAGKPELNVGVTKGVGSTPTENDVPRRRKIMSGKESAKNGFAKHGMVLTHSD